MITSEWAYKFMTLRTFVFHLFPDTNSVLSLHQYCIQQSRNQNRTLPGQHRPQALQLISNYYSLPKPYSLTYILFLSHRASRGVSAEWCCSISGLNSVTALPCYHLKGLLGNV
uniref:Uncharacterized protein n=1 Tax=Arion vulgaris TaxID=1028688 RepID=A0A0B6Z0X6_9EUPU